MYEPSLYPTSVGVDLSSAPSEATGNIGFNSKDLPDGLSIHYLGLNQATWQTLIMTYYRDTVSSYAGVKICDIYLTMMSVATTSHDCLAKDIATIKSWVNKLFFLIDVGVHGMPALFTPASQARSADDPSSDFAKLLVLVIPDLVLVR